MVSNEDAFFKELLSMFKIEAEEHIKSMSSGLLDLEKLEPGREYMHTIETVYREAHSLKGAARSVNLIKIETVCQSLETIFAAIKKQTIEFNPSLFDTLHQSVDTISDILEDSDHTDISGVMQKLTEIEKKYIGKKSAPDTDLIGEPVPEVSPTTKPETKKESEKPALPKNKKEPVVPQPVPESVIPDAPILAEPEPEPVSAVKSATVISDQDKAIVSDTIRISTSKLDKLLLQAEEMLAAKLTSEQNAADLRDLNIRFENWKKLWEAMDEEIRHEFQELRKNAVLDPDELMKWFYENIANVMDLNRQLIKDFDVNLGSLYKMAKDNARSLGGMVDTLLEDMKEVLMLPFSTLLRILPKIVRDLSRDQGKEVELIVRGSTIEIDRRILEELKDPFIHLLRNCVDHGIEKPEVRIKNKKPKSGTISVSIIQRSGNKVEILINDDGGGIDPEKVRSVAVKKGVITETEAAKLTRDECLMLIFQSEVSTSPIITDISGRGLGMPIVREKVEILGGSISINTEVGKGTTFKIQLPVTLATFRGILVRVSEFIYVVPTINVDRVIRIPADNIKTVETRETITLDGETVALAQLDATLGIGSNGSKVSNDGFISCIVLGADDKKIAFSVDEVINEQEVLVKGLDKPLVRIRNISGATILGNGQVIPILNASDLIKSAMLLEYVSQRTQKSEEKQLGKKSILVAEDSITSRTLLKNILESAGYSVTTTVDGMDALTALKSKTYDLVVSDIEMPRMNGFDLVTKIRSDRKMAELPIVLVTALESREDRERGIDVGANAYIVKRSFDQSNLLEVIRKLI